MFRPPQRRHQAVLLLLARACSTACSKPQYFGFWGPDSPSQMRAFTNLAFASDVADVRANRAAGVTSLLKIEQYFVNTTVRWQFELYPDADERWGAAVPTITPLLGGLGGGVVALFLGDELLWNGLPYTSLQRYAKMVRASFPRSTDTSTPTVALYTNGAWPTLFPTVPGEAQQRGTLGRVPDANVWHQIPDELDWFSVDMYPDQFSIGGWLTTYHAWVVPKLAPHHMLVLVPPFYGDTADTANATVGNTTALLDCGDATEECDTAMLRWAKFTQEWAVGGQFRDSERIVAVTPYHWGDLNGGIGPRSLGGKHLPKATAAWVALGKSILAKPTDN